MVDFNDPQMDMQTPTQPHGLPPMPGIPASTQLPAGPTPDQVIHALTQAAPTPTINKDALGALGARLAGKFSEYVSSRQLAEKKWMQNARQFLGIYDPDVAIPSDRSKAYPKLTRVKTVSMVSRLMNMLFPGSEKNWTLAASPVPNLPPMVMQKVLNEAFAYAQEQQLALTPEIIEGFVSREAATRAYALEKEIEDQLAEIGGTRQLDYVAICRKVIYSGVLYGCGVVKGPFVRSQVQSRWTQDPQTGQFALTTVDVKRPQLEFISLWDYYPDMSAKTFAMQEGQFIRHVLSKHQFRRLADDPLFMRDQILEYLQMKQTGNYVRQTYETELKSMGVNSNVNDQAGSKYELREWNGYISGRELQAAGVDIVEDRLTDEFEAVVWLVDNTVIRAELNPWVELEPNRKVEMFHQFVFEEDETTLLGNGLPNIMRDSQMGVCIGTRMMFDNAAVTCGPVLELNTDLVRADQDLQNVSGFKIFYREGTGADAAQPAIRQVNINGHLGDLKGIVEMFGQFADTETFIGPATGGDMAKAPSEPMRTAAGASMLRGDAALPFKDVLRNFDMFTQSVLTSLLVFNEQFNSKEELIGDAQVIPRGATSLMAKEVRGMTLDNLAQTLQPDERAYLNKYEFLRERLAVRDVDLRSLLVSEEEAKQIDARQAEAATKAAQQNEELVRAEVRKVLADATKALTQSEKNSATADVSRANAVLAALEKGVQAEGGENGGKQ